jgi:uncharacterized glyoxalase superfamily protein PhnB
VLTKADPVLRVESTEAARSFFNTLGFEMTFHAPAVEGLQDPAWMNFRRDAVVLKASSHSGDGDGAAVVMIRAADVDALHREFVARGVVIDMPPTDQSWGLREMYVKDSMRNSLRFFQPLD